MIEVGRARRWLAGLSLAVAVTGSMARAQAPTPPVTPPAGGVVHPPASIDPGIKVAPRNTVRLPTPVVHPPVRRGDTVVVPR